MTPISIRFSDYSLHGYTLSPRYQSMPRVVLSMTRRTTRSDRHGPRRLDFIRSRSPRLLVQVATPSNVPSFLRVILHSSCFPGNAQLFESTRISPAPVPTTSDRKSAVHGKRLPDPPVKISYRQICTASGSVLVRRVFSPLRIHVAHSRPSAFPRW